MKSKPCIRAKSERRSRWEQLTRDAIHDGVLRVLTQKGDAGLTMENVAAEAGVAKGTLYTYFKDKSDLLESVKESSLEPLRKELLALLEGPLPPHERLNRLVERHLGYFDEHREFYRVLLWQRQSAKSRLKRQRSDPYRVMVDKIADCIRDGIGEHLFKPLDATKVAAMLMEANIAMIGQRLWEEKPGPLEEDARLIIELFLHGLLAGASDPRSRAPLGSRP